MKPVHLMRFAPADYVNDPAVKLALVKRDFVSSTFYPLFLFHAFTQGGRLPADPVTLGAILGMRPADVRKALAYWTAQGKVKEADGSVYHERILRDLDRELAFREEQSERGKLSASRRLASTTGASTGRFNPPVPAPVPAPAPAPTPPPAPEPRVGPVGALEKAQAECQSELDQAAEATRIPPDALLAKYSRTPNGASIQRIDTCQSVPWLRTTAQKLRSTRLATVADAADRPMNGFAALAARVGE